MTIPFNIPALTRIQDGLPQPFLLRRLHGFEPIRHIVDCAEADRKGRLFADRGGGNALLMPFGLSMICADCIFMTTMLLNLNLKNRDAFTSLFCDPPMEFSISSPYTRQ